jgi:hypothetical protein
MNTLGKILVVLIFVMSIFFMAFSFMVYLTHTNWETKAQDAEKRVTDARRQNEQLNDQIAKLNVQRAAENAARKSQLALLETRNSSNQEQLVAQQRALGDLQASLREANDAIGGSTKQLEIESGKVAALRDSVKKAEADRDKMFVDVTELNDRVLQLEAINQRLDAREQDLLTSLGRFKALSRAHDISEFDDITNIPPPRDGEVSRVDGENKFVAITLGSDDGLRKGHKLDVARGEKYLGRIQITTTHSDRSVGRVLPDYRKGAIRIGDRVRTK